MKKLLCGFAFTAVALAVSTSLFCSKKSPTAPEVQDYTGTISGFVVSRLDSKPLANIIVSINADSSHPSVTSVSGYFEIGSVKAGTHELHFTGVDYQDTSGVTVTVSKGQDLTLRDTVRLSYRWYILTGVIKYNTSPIPGAGVAVGNTPISSLVGTDGKYTLDRVPKSDDIELICAKSKVGFATYKVTNAVANGITKVPDILLKEEGATVEGIIYDTAGHPMPNVIVAAVGGGLVDTTNKEGHYHLENVPSNMDIRIFVPGQEGLAGAVTGLIAANGANLSGIDIHLRPVFDLSSGNGMALTVNDFFVVDTTKIARLSVYPTTNDTTIITGYRWTLTGSKTATVTTTGPVLPVSTDTLEKMGLAASQGIAVRVTVVSINSHNLESRPQTFQVLVSSNKPVVSAKCSDSAKGTQKDSVSIEAGGWVWLFGNAFAPFGGIDTMIWNFGDSTPARKMTDTLSTISHKYSNVGAFKAIYSAVYGGGMVSDTVFVKTTASPIPTPVLVSPADKDTNKTAADSMTFVWHSVAGTGITYNVYFDPNNNPPATAAAQGTADTSVRIRIDSGVSGYWTVEAVRSGKTGPQAKAWFYYGRIGKKPTNRPPAFSTRPADMRDTALAGQIYKDTILAVDPNDSDAVSYSFKDSAAGMKLTGGIITWTPAPADTGRRKVTVMASDGHGGRDSLTWSILVIQLDTLLHTVLLTPSNDTVLAGWTANISWNVPDSSTTQLWLGLHPDSLSPVGNYGTTAAYSKSGLDGNVTYYWRIAAKFTGGKVKWTPIWQFTAGNHAPDMPQLISPANGAKVVVPFKLTWACGDSDKADTLRYDVYFGRTNPPLKVAGNIRALSYDITSIPAQVCYWHVGVSDGRTSKLTDTVFTINAVTADTISYGNTYADSLGAGRQKAYQFQGAAGDLVTVRVTTVSGNPYPGLHLNSAEGLSLKEGNWSTGSNTYNFISDFKLAAGGTYSVVIEAYSGGSGRVQMRIMNRKSLAAGATSINFGQTVKDSLVWGETRAYKVSGQANHLVFLAGSSAIKYWFDSTKNEEVPVYTWNSQKLDTLKASGDQIVYIHADAPWSGTAYSFRILDLSATADTLKYNDTTSAAATFPYDCKPYVFQGQAGDFVTVRVNTVSGTVYPGMQLFSSAGQYLKSGAYGIGSGAGYTYFNDFKLPANGTYSLVFGAYDAGRFQIRFINRKSLAAGATSINFGQMVKDSLVWGETRAYKVSGQANHLVFLAGSGATKYWFDSTKGEEVPVYTWNSQKLDTLKASGDQIVCVHADAPWSGTAYSFRILDLSVTADTLKYNDTTTAAATIPYDCKPYVFQGQAGDLVTVRVNTVSGTVYPGMQLFSSAGQYLKSGAYGIGSGAGYTYFNDFKLPANGTYSLVFGAYDAGRYQIRFINRKSLAAGATSIAFGQVVTASLAWGEIRAYKFSAAANQLVRLAGSSNACYWYDSVQNQNVAVSSTAALKLDTVKTAGDQVIYVDAVNATWAETQYQFKMMDASNIADTLHYGDSISVAFPILGDSKAFIVKGAANDLETIAVNDVSGNPYAGLKLFDMNGKLLKSVPYGNSINSINDDTLASTNSVILFVDAYPSYNGTSALKMMKTGPASPWVPSQPSDVQYAGGMALIKAGGYSFRMGSWSTANESPVHIVSLTKDFWIDTIEVTQGDYKTLMGVNPSTYKTDSVRNPVETITWYDAVLYCNARSRRDGLDTVYDYTATPVNPGNGCTSLQNLTADFSRSGYRLPTEAQWEYACRGGTATTYYWGSSIADNRLWYYNNSSGTTHPVAGKGKNAYGLYDMEGNVWEMCGDNYGSYPFAPQADPAGPSSGSSGLVVRGGAFNSSDGTSSMRANTWAYQPYQYFGFRVVKPGP